MQAKPPTPLPSVVITNPLDAKIAAAVRDLPTGTIVVNAPVRARVGDETAIEVVVKDQVRLAVDEVLRKEPVPAGNATTVAHLAISRQMNAQLYGDPSQVRIAAQQPDADYLTFGPDGTIAWRWTIEPRTAGDIALRLVVGALLNVPQTEGSRDPTRVQVVTKDLTFHVAANFPRAIMQGISNNWTWFWAAIVVPIATVAWAWMHRRREQKSSNA